VFESLSQKLDKVFKNVRGQGKLTEKNMKDSLQEIRMALLEADVNYKVVKGFVASVQEAALGQEVLNSVSPGQQIVKIVYDELVKTMGTSGSPLRLEKEPPTIVMMVGLQGQGKTTTSGKLAHLLKRHGKNCLLVGADVYRPAAIKQLEVVAEQAGAKFFSLGEHADPVDTCLMARGEAKRVGADIIILDTAGRLHINSEMMGELKRIHTGVKPHEILFVASAMTGQDAVNSAKQFHETLPLTGVILTQMDGDARGGAALSLVKVTGCPIKFIGTGEKIDALDTFHPRRVADQILGMGDIVALVEKAQQHIDVETAINFQEKARKATLDLNDLLQQMQQLKKMGPLQDLLKKIPGMAKMMDKQGFDMDPDEMKRTEAIIQSMTPYERTHPKLINGSRRRRIADGSGMQVQDINRLLKDFEHSKKMMKGMMKSFKRPPRGPMPPGMQ
jgi:signal recognition particle subunit SRP54